jgi:hypothetical protein
LCNFAPLAQYAVLRCLNQQFAQKAFMFLCYLLFEQILAAQKEKQNSP